MALKACVLLIVLLSVCGLPLALAAGGSSCWAAPASIFGPTCSSDTSIWGSPGHKIRYSVSVSGSTLICCKAFHCKGNNCDLYDAGCGHGSWSTTMLTWGNNLATPKMKCKGIPLGSFYSFTH